MKYALILTFVVCIFFIVPAGSIHAQSPIVRKDIYFIVRKPDMVKNIATRFHLPAKTLVHLNIPLRKRQTVYAGKKLLIPVWLKRKNNATGTDYNLADYELDTDSLDIYIREDFVCMADIEADTVRRIIIDRDIRRIDKKIAVVNLQLDSIEESGMRMLSNKDIRKMPMDRARRIGSFTAGRLIDTLVQQKKLLVEEKNKIDVRVADYEYLVENASYAASHTSEEDTKTIQIKDWAADPDKPAAPAPKGKK